MSDDDYARLYSIIDRCKDRVDDDAADLVWLIHTLCKSQEQVLRLTMMIQQMPAAFKEVT